MGHRLEVRLDEAARRRALAEDVRRGLTAAPKSLPPKYFYDAAGSRLFGRITELPEYYLTRAERRLLERRVRDVMRLARPAEIVELGAGSADKARILLAAADGGVRRYCPVDVDETTLMAAADELVTAHPTLEVHGVVGDFERHLDAVPAPAGRRLVVFLGSTVGNLDPGPRRRLLRAVRRLLRPGDRFLLGVDLVKDRAVLEAAYDDAAGVTAEFNRNVLRVISRELHADFDPTAFRHRAWYDPEAARVEMHLAPVTPQTAHVRDLGLTVEIGPDETIWTESSYKFTEGSVDAMLAEAGLGLEGWYAPDGVALALAVAA